MSEQTPESIGFNQLSLAPALLSQLDDIGYHTMTPVQAQSLPVTLANTDAVVQASI